MLLSTLLVTSIQTYCSLSGVESKAITQEVFLPNKEILSNLALLVQRSCPRYYNLIPVIHTRYDVLSRDFRESAPFWQHEIRRPYPLSSSKITIDQSLYAFSYTAWNDSSIRARGSEQARIQIE